MSTEPKPIVGQTPASPTALNLDDPKVLESHLKLLVPIALQMLKDGFGLKVLRVRDEAEAYAALWSAHTSYLRHGFADAKTPEELAAELLRIAKNRAQRRLGQEKHMNQETGAGTVAGPDGSPISRDYEDKSIGPDQIVEQKELLTNLWEVIDEIKEKLGASSPRRKIVELYLEDMKEIQDVIAKKVGVHQSTVARTINWFHDQIRTLHQETDAV